MPRARPSPHHALAGRGLKIAHNAELRQKFNDPKTGFPVGSLLTFAAFTSVSLDDKVANGFGDHVLFNFIRLLRHGAQRAYAHAADAEVLVPPPSVFRIVTVAMFHGSLIVTLEQVESPLTYLEQPSSTAPAPPLLIPAAAATSPTAANSLQSSALSSLSIVDVAVLVPPLPPPPS